MFSATTAENESSAGNLRPLPSLPEPSDDEGDYDSAVESDSD